MKADKSKMTSFFIVNLDNISVSKKYYKDIYRDEDYNMLANFTSNVDKACVFSRYSAKKHCKLLEKLGYNVAVEKLEDKEL